MTHDTIETMGNNINKLVREWFACKVESDGGYEPHATFICQNNFYTIENPTKEEDLIISMREDWIKCCRELCMPERYISTDKDALFYI